MNSQQSFTMLIAPDGVMQFIYDDNHVEFLRTGTASVERASYVEPCDGRWEVDLSPIGGGTYGPFILRQQAMEFELKFINFCLLEKGQTMKTAAVKKTKVAVISEHAQQIYSEAEQAPSSDMTDKAMCLVVSTQLIGRSRKVDSSKVEVDADKERIGVHKSLFDCEELKQILRHEFEVRRFVMMRALPSMFKQGVYMLPYSLVDEVDIALQKFAQERTELVGKFCDSYNKIVKQSKIQLKALFDPDDYPPVEIVRSAFTFSWHYLQFGVPGKLKQISSSMFHREQQKATERWKEAMEAAQVLLRESMADLVSHMVDRLSSEKDGKPKVFRNTLMENINEFLTTFDARNIVEDKQLKALVDKARLLLKGVDPEMLRKDEDIRKNVQEGFSLVKQQLDTMLADRPKRKFKKED